MQNSWFIFCICEVCSIVWDVQHSQWMVVLMGDHVAYRMLTLRYTISIVYWIILFVTELGKNRTV
jgi:hypothetical protein